jgi:hypothetical protein
MSKRPISAGDVCLVVDGVLKQKSPNIGKQVTVRSLQGQHSSLGNIWRCAGPELVSFNDDKPPDGCIDFAACWLQRIDPPEGPAKVVEKSLEIS